MSEAQQEAETIIKALEAENARLRAALKPFAEWGEIRGHDDKPYRKVVDFVRYSRDGLTEVVVTYADLLRAAEALAANQEPSE